MHQKAPNTEIPAKTFEFDFEAADHIPKCVRFGASSWNYPGWKGLIYPPSGFPEKLYSSAGLPYYSAVPWFRSVQVDTFFYRPPTIELLTSYAEQVPPDFQFVSKVWEEITIPKFPEHARYGAKRNQDNPLFLNVDAFLAKVLPAYKIPALEAGHGGPGKVGPFIFQFPFIAPEVMKRETFLQFLESFLARLPKTFRYAVEIRNRDFLVDEYFSVLNLTGATHCFTFWNYMQPMVEQMKAAARAGGLHAPFYVARIETPPGVDFTKAGELFAPFDTLKRVDEGMRTDAIRLAKRAIEKNVDAYIMVSNSAEGCAPMTIDAIGRTLAGQLQKAQ